MVKKIVIGIAVSAVFVYFALKGVDLREVWASLHGKQYFMLIPAGVTFVLCQVVKSLRWGVILSPIKKIPQRVLFPIASIGFMAIIVAPMRLGEIVRPYLASAKAEVPMGSGLATILVERLMDLLMLLLFLFLVLSQIPLPSWLMRGGTMLLAIVALEFSVIFLFMLWPKAITRILVPITSRLPGTLGEKIEHFVFNVSSGFKVISSVGKFVRVLVLSILVWGLSALAVYLLAVFYGFKFGLVEALAVTSITALGISIPAAPGLIGNFQFACMVALSFWGIGKTEAFTFSMVYYIMGVGINLLLGVVFLPTVDIPLSRMFRPGGGNRQTKAGPAEALSGEHQK